MTKIVLVFITFSALLFSGCEDLKWERVESGTSGLWLRDIWGASADDVWAVGENGTVLHWDGLSWCRHVSENIDYRDIYAVWGTDSTDVWAAGQLGAIYHWDGTSWSRFDSDEARRFRSVWGSSSDSIWAVGTEYDNYTVLIHWDGVTWSDVDHAFVNDLQGLWGMGSEFVVAVGSDGGGINTSAAAFVWDGESWTDVSSGCGSCEEACWLNSVWFSKHNDVWAVGGYYCGKHSYTGHVLHWSGQSSTWESVEIEQVDELYDIWGRTGSDIWAVGRDILYWNGQSWSSEKSEANHLRAVWGIGDDVWAVGAEGTILRRRK